MVGRVTNVEWIQLGRELEKDASGNPWRFWVGGNRRSKDSMSHIHNENGQVLVYR